MREIRLVNLVRKKSQRSECTEIINEQINCIKRLKKLYEF